MSYVITIINKYKYSSKEKKIFPFTRINCFNECVWFKNKLNFLFNSWWDVDKNRLFIVVKRKSNVPSRLEFNSCWIELLLYANVT